VVEVGVDVPNATLMTIESGERFGLAQLHQLRGRISRGKYPGFCCVFASPQSEESQERLKALEASSDGFQLAEIDFRLRGPGNCSARDSTACRHCGWPTYSATPIFWSRPGAMPWPWLPTQDWHCRR